MNSIKTSFGNKIINYDKKTNKITWKYIICLSELPPEIEEYIGQMIYKYKFIKVWTKIPTHNYFWKYESAFSSKYYECGVICKNGNKCRLNNSNSFKYEEYLQISCPYHLCHKDIMNITCFKPKLCGKHSIKRKYDTYDIYVNRMRDTYMKSKGFEYNKHGYIIQK